MHSSGQHECSRDWSHLPHDSRDVKTNTTIPQHAEQMKEDAANGEARKGRHVAECETARRRDPLDDGVDRYEGVWPVNGGER